VNPKSRRTKITWSASFLLFSKNIVGRCFLIVLNSPRTSDDINQIIKNNLKCDHIFFNFLEIKNNNPYIASLGYGDYFIATGDSVSMISECCSTGKPVFIFDDKSLTSLKHRIFHQHLFTNNYALPFSNKINLNQNHSLKKLQEAKRISSLICDKF
jgi:mitochondrial fission protein ELM1